MQDDDGMWFEHLGADEAEVRTVVADFITHEQSDSLLGAVYSSCTKRYLCGALTSNMGSWFQQRALQ